MVIWPESGPTKVIVIRLIAQRQVKSYVARKVHPSKVSGCRRWLVKHWTAHRMMISINNVQTSGWEADCQQRHVATIHHKSQIIRFGKNVNKEIKIRIIQNEWLGICIVFKIIVMISLSRFFCILLYTSCLNATFFSNVYPFSFYYEPSIGSYKEITAYM
jgi:hypothetical protein